MFNTTYLMTFPDSGKKAVLRTGPVNRELLLPFEENLMRAEELFYSLCGEDIPVPEVIACETDKSIIDCDYMITGYIEGCLLSSCEIPKEEKAAIFEAVGRYTRWINGIKGKKFGRLSEVLRGRGRDKWSDYLAFEISLLMQKALREGIFSEEQSEQIQGVFERFRDVLDEISTPRLCHADLWDGNVLVSRTEDGYKVTAIIDADRSIWGDPEFELASGWIINDAFLRGYANERETNASSVSRREIYALVYNLIDAYVCLAEYNDKEKSDANKNSALTLLSKLTARGSGCL